MIYPRYIRVMFSAGLLFLTSSIFTSTSLFAQTTFSFTAIPDQDETRLQQRFGQFADYLSEALAVEVKYIPMKSYSAAITAFRNNQVQLAWFGGLSGVRARALVPGSEAIAQGVEDQFFTTYFIANSSTGLKKTSSFPMGIAGRTLTFGAMGSTSGRLMPEHYIRNHFSKPVGEIFRRVGFSDNHSRTISLVQSGAYEIGTVNVQVWNAALKEKKIDTSKVNVIWETPPYPDYHWTIRGDVNEIWGENFKNRVTATLLEITNETLLNQFPRSGFVPTDNSHYQEIIDVGKSVGLLE